MIGSQVPAVSGIYLIRNIANGMVYIGQTINLRLRRSTHVASLKYGYHCNYRLQNDYDKSGKGVFEFVMLEQVSEEMLDNREAYWIGYYRSTDSRFGYNIGAWGEGIKHHTQESKTRMSISHIGLRHTEEEKRKISKSRTGYVVPPESRKRMSEAKRMAAARAKALMKL